MIVVLLGFVLNAAIYTAAALNPSWPVEVLYAATAVVDITGSWVVFNMAVYSYLADITPGTKRTKRMGYTDAIWYLGGPIGTWFGGWLYQNFGYATVFSVSGCVWLACVFYICIGVEESVVRDSESDSEAKKKCHHHLVELGQTALRRYVNGGRLHLFALMAIKLGLFLTQGHQVCSISPYNRKFFRQLIIEGVLMGKESPWLEHDAVLRVDRRERCSPSNWHADPRGLCIVLRHFRSRRCYSWLDICWTVVEYACFRARAIAVVACRHSYLFWISIGKLSTGHSQSNYQHRRQKRRWEGACAVRTT